MHGGGGPNNYRPPVASSRMVAPVKEPPGAEPPLFRFAHRNCCFKEGGKCPQAARSWVWMMFGEKGHRFIYLAGK